MSDTKSDGYSINLFYRDFYQQIVYALIVSIFAMLIVVGAVLWQVFHRPIPEFAAVMPDKRGIRLTPYDEPNLLPATILRWASKAAVASYTFNFVDYEKQIGLARPYFTEGGWTAYQNAIDTVVNKIKKGQLFVYGVVSGPPVISNQGERPGHGYSWRIQIPFLVTYQSAEESKSQEYYVLLTVVKVPTTVNIDAIGIETFEMRG